MKWNFDNCHPLISGALRRRVPSPVVSVVVCLVRLSPQCQIAGLSPEWDPETFCDPDYSVPGVTSKL